MDDTKILLAREVVSTSPLAVGCRLWSSLTIDDAIEIVSQAAQFGMNMFDTADIYGMGKSEEILGQAISHFDRQKIVIATKGGIRKSENGHFNQDSSPKHLRTAIAASLQRLQTDYIDLYQIHYADLRTHPHETAQALANFVETGEIKAIGLSNVDKKSLQAWLKQDYVPVASLQMPWNLLQRQALPIIQMAREAGLRILGYTPLLAGLLTPNDPEHLRSELPPSAMETALALRDTVNHWAKQNDLTLPEVSLGWALGSEHTDITLLGIRKSSRLLEAQRAVRVASNSSFLSKMKELEKHLPGRITGSVLAQEVTAIEQAWDGTPLATVPLGFNILVPQSISVGTKIEIDVFTGKFVQAV